jgi:hypothetical protein
LPVISSHLAGDAARRKPRSNEVIPSPIGTLVDVQVLAGEQHLRDRIIILLVERQDSKRRQVRMLDKETNADDQPKQQQQHQ